MFSHFVHLSDGQAHLKGTGLGVCPVCLGPMGPVLFWSVPIELSRSKKMAAGSPLGLSPTRFLLSAVSGATRRLHREHDSPQHPGLMGDQMKVLQSLRGIWGHIISTMLAV